MIAEFMRSLFWVSLTGGVFILAAVLVRAGMKHRLPKHFLVLLWVAVLLHFLFLLETPSPTSIYNYVYFRSPVALDAPVAVDPMEASEDVSETVSSGAPIVAESLPVTGMTSFDVFFLVWGAGAALLLAFFVVSYWRTVRRFDEAFVLKNNAIVNAWLAERSDPPKVYVSDRTTTPMAFGIIRSRIVLPNDFDLGNASLLRSVLEHEYIHGRNFHNAIKVLVYLAVALHWFNPLVWVYWILFTHDMELACDERVIQAIGPSRRAEYAHSLVAVAEKAVVPFPLISAFSARSLKERIVDVMGYKRTTFSLLAVEIVLVATLFALFGTSPLSSIRGEVPSSKSPAFPLSPTQVASVFLEGANPTEVAVALTGGGTVVKRETEEWGGKTLVEYKILSEPYEYTIRLDVDDRAVVKYERRMLKSRLDARETAQLVPMAEASREALRSFPRGRVGRCELKREREEGYVYLIKVEADGREYEVEVDANSGAVRDRARGGGSRHGGGKHWR